jgi:tetratricopeptide (TPR) repeat protein
MARPNDGKVADNGVFVLNDWELSGDLSGVFSAYRPDGKNILSRRFRANLYNNGLASDGSLAVCQTCNSPDPNDSSVLAVFDLISGIEIAAWRPESGWARFYEFPPDHQSIKLGYAAGETLSYSLRGAFVDRVHWANVELGKGNLSMVERLIQSAEAGVSSALAEKLIGSIDIALSAQPADGRTRAWAFKLRGLCLESQGKLAAALLFYQKALELDPKIGVKRRAEQLRKRVP